jgi:hypothetical protein
MTNDAIILGLGVLLATGLVLASGGEPEPAAAPGPPPARAGLEQLRSTDEVPAPEAPPPAEPPTDLTPAARELRDCVDGAETEDEVERCLTAAAPAESRDVTDAVLANVEPDAPLGPALRTLIAARGGDPERAAALVDEALEEMEADDDDAR